jgi:hypothetical protein
MAFHWDFFVAPPGLLPPLADRGPIAPQLKYKPIAACAGTRLFHSNLIASGLNRQSQGF